MKTTNKHDEGFMEITYIMTIRKIMNMNNRVKTKCIGPKWAIHAMFLQVMKCNQRLYDN